MIIHNGGILHVVIQHFWKCSPFHHNVYISTVFVWMAKDFMTLRCSHGHAKASIERCLHVFHLSSIFNVFLTNSIIFGMQLNLSMCGITCFRGFGQIVYLMVVYPMVVCSIVYLMTSLKSWMTKNPKSFQTLFVKNN
jgi:hypothetical protein